jgi:tripartite ATP-independent transporter DctM subunit
MSIAYTSTIVIFSFFSLMILGLPVAFCLIGCAAIFTITFWNPAAIYMVATTIFNISTQDIFLAIPLFVFLAAVLESSGIVENLYDMFYKWFGRLKGGLAIGSVLMCTVCDAISGLGATGIVTVGPIAMPEMFKRKYHKTLSIGSIAAGSALGPLIPPSVIMIIISGYTGLSVGKLFAAGLFPGLLCSAGFCLYILIACLIWPQMGPAFVGDKPVNWHDRIISLRAVVLPILLIVAVMGSIYTGICTPTEGAAVGAGGALLCSAFNRKLNYKTLYKAGIQSIKITCMVMWLLIGGSMFATLLSALQIQQALGGFLSGIQSSYGAMGLLYVILGIVFIMGMFIDGAAITVLTMPVFWPVIQSTDIDPLLFGTLFTIDIVIGYLTPPFGMNLFYAKGITPPHITMYDIYTSIFPYIAIMAGVMILTLYLPEIAVWLPNNLSF